MSEAAVELLLQALREFGNFMENGGFVMWPLVVATIALWYGIGYRAMMLRRGTALGVRSVISQYRHDLDRPVKGFVEEAARLAIQVRRQESGNIRRQLDDELFFLVESLSRYRVLVRTIVAVAPLAGLLGTVTGMIEMFQSLGDQTFFSQSGGVANGISQALITTQFGLVIAVPGMIVGRLLDRRENRIRNDIDQIKDMLSPREGEALAS